MDQDEPDPIRSLKYRYDFMRRMVVLNIPSQCMLVVTVERKVIELWSCWLTWGLNHRLDQFTCEEIKSHHGNVVINLQKNVNSIKYLSFLMLTSNMYHNTLEIITIFMEYISQH